MHSSSEQLLPIVSGCEALVVSGSFAGKSVSVHCQVAADGWYVFRGQQAWLNPALSGCWVCQLTTGNRAALVFPSHYLMRIDGYETKMRPEGVDRLIGMQMSVKINKRVQK